MNKENKTKKPQNPLLDIADVNCWHIVQWDVDIPMKKSQIIKRFGKPIFHVISNNCRYNGFRPDCIYQHKKDGNKIIMIYDDSPKDSIHNVQWAVYACS